MGRLVFLSIPESLHSSLEQNEGGFAVNPAIPIPVEEDAVENLSLEAMLSGMIRFLMEAPPKAPPEHIAYYRAFVRAARPNIRAEFSGAALVKAGNADYSLALEIAAALEAIFPKSEAALLTKARVLELHAEAPDQPERETTRARAEALAAYEQTLAASPAPETLFYAGFFFMKHQRFDRARQCFQEFLTRTEGESPLAEERRRAEAGLREIQQHKLDDASFLKAYNALLAENAEEALPAIHSFLEQHSNVWNGWFLLGWALRILKRWNDGAAALAKALDLGGDNTDTLNELAICLMESGDHTGARKHLERALRLEPDNVKLISNLGVLAARTGNHTEAAAFFRTAQALSFD
jgi:tetratricopeptide (TPR) repeat protein